MTHVRPKSRVAALALALATALAVPFAAPTALAQTADKAAGAQDRGKGKGSGSPSMQMHRSMMEGMKAMQHMRMSGDMDRDFATMMRKHHEDGVKMAQFQMEHGKDAKMREMARSIMDQQKKEIAEFDEWMKKQPKAAPSSK